MSEYDMIVISTKMESNKITVHQKAVVDFLNNGYEIIDIQHVPRMIKWETWITFKKKND